MLKIKTVHIRIDEHKIKLLDDVCSLRMVSRNFLISKLISDFLENKDE